MWTSVSPWLAVYSLLVDYLLSGGCLAGAHTRSHFRST